MLILSLFWSLFILSILIIFFVQNLSEGTSVLVFIKHWGHKTESNNYNIFEKKRTRNVAWNILR